MRGETMCHKDDIIGFVFPCYRGSIPTVVEEFISSHSFEAKYIFAIITYGNVSMGAEKHFREICHKHNIEINYSSCIKMVDTSLKFYDMEKQLKRLEKKEVESHLNVIINDVHSKTCNKGKGNIITCKLSKIGYSAYRKEIGDCDKLFLVEDHCTKCKVCERVCPVDNITVSHKVYFKHHCIRCYACTQNCPSNAIRFNGEKSKARYRNNKISLKEIIDSNSKQ